MGWSEGRQFKLTHENTFMSVWSTSDGRAVILQQVEVDTVRVSKFMYRIGPQCICSAPQEDDQTNAYSRRWHFTAARSDIKLKHVRRRV